MNKCYSGYLVDKKKLIQSSSGGIVSALSEVFIENDGIVFGTKYSKDFKHVEYSYATSINEIDEFKGTKYCETKKVKDGKHIFQSVAEFLKQGRLVLFVGLGCDIGALTLYCAKNEIDTKNLYLVDIVCHGPVPTLVLEKYIELLEKRNNSKLVSFNMRQKIEGWAPFFVVAIFENGNRYIEQFDKTEFALAFKHVAKVACANCKFKGSNHQGDICVGDCWGLNSHMAGWNADGVSAIIVQTIKGTKLLDMLDERFVYQEIDKDFVIEHNAMYIKSRISNVNYSGFMEDLQKNGLCDAVKKFPQNKITIRQIIKTVLPTAIIQRIRNAREISEAKKINEFKES